MRLKPFRALLPLLLALPGVAQAQAARHADPALWVVKDEDTTIYLFGTIHVLKPGMAWFDDAVKTAFDKSDELKLEMVEPDPATTQGLIMKLGLDLQGPTLPDQLPPEKRAAYAKALADLNLPADALDHLRPWLAAVQLSVAPLAKLGYDPNSGAERVLSAAAKANGKRITGLETMEEQIGYLAGLSSEQQVKYLVKVIDDLPRTGPELDAMVADWAKGDPDALASMMNEELKTTPEIAKTLLTDRNARWADWISRRMAQPGTVFIAVGAGHLAGPDSVQAFLAKHNLKATRIQY